MAEAKGKNADPNAVPVWLITPDRELCDAVTRGLARGHTCRVEGVCKRWQCAIQTLASVDGERQKVVVVDRNPVTSEGKSCLSFLRNLGDGFSTVVLMSEAADENLFPALAMGVSGFIVKPASAVEIAAAVESVARGEVWMKRQVLERIASLIPHVILQNSFPLTNREQEIVGLALEGHSTRVIADKLNISYYTADTHIKNIYQKLKVNNRSSLVSLVLQSRR